MFHWAGMNGRLVDGRGEPVPKAQMLLITGNLALGADTDAAGKFRLPLQPGDAYTLSVLPPLGWKPPDPEPEGGRVLGWARTYYPGVASPEAAAKIVLPPGGELSDVDLKLAAVPAHAVRGVLLNPDGRPAPKVAITAGEDYFTPVLRVESKPDGTFEFPLVVDGQWRLSAELASDGEPLRLLRWIEMAGHELEGLKVQFAAPFTVSGRVVMAAPEGVKPPKGPPVSVSAAARGDMREPPLYGHVEADGSFDLERVYPGVYRLNAPNSPPPGYYLGSVRLGEAEIAAPQVELFSGAGPLTLVYKTNGGTVRGTVEKCASGGVVLIPQDRARRWPALILSARCDSSDRYQIPAVRPGEYYALVFPKDGSSPLWAPRFDEFDESLFQQAGKVTVRAGETSGADLRAIPAR
jgi:hypothetical protein